MNYAEYLKLAKIRPWGTILLGKNIRCDGEGYVESDTFERKVACYSHIHSDHMSGFEDSLTQCDAVIVTKETKEMLIEWKGTWLQKKNNLIGLRYNEPYTYKNETITLLPSGHILGSAQILIESDNKKILYSSDFNYPGAMAIDSVDVLVLDSTHGDPQYVDNIPSERKLDQITKLVTEELEIPNPVIIHAARGKIQYLMFYLRNKIRRHSIPFVASIDDVNISKAFSRLGMPTGTILHDDSEEFFKLVKNQEPYVRFAPHSGMMIPCEMQNVRSIRIGNPPEYHYPETNMFQINLSDHADFNGMLEYVHKLNPKLVITDNSGRTADSTAISLAKFIKKRLGIDAIPQGKRITI